GLCVECAVDLGQGLACRRHCEESAQALIDLIDRNIQFSMTQTKAHLVVTPAVQRPSPPNDYIAARLSVHIRETLNFQWRLGAFCSIVGAILLVAGTSEQMMVMDVIGVCFIGFGS